MAMKIPLTLAKNQVNLAVDPISLQPLSSDGAPTTVYTLQQNYATGIIAFKVPDGVYWQIVAQPSVRMTFFQDAAGTTQIQSGDTVEVWVKSPADPPNSLGVKIVSMPYSDWYEVNAQGVQQQMLPSYASSLKWPMFSTLKVETNQVLIIAISTLFTGETVNWTLSKISIPATQISN